MKNFRLHSVLILLLCALLSYTSLAEEYKIGFSQCNTSDLWRQNQIRFMEIELSFHPELELIIKDAEDNTQTQIQQIEELVKLKVDLIIVSPIESQPVAPIIEKVYRQGIPVIIIDRKVDTELYTTFIGGDNFVIGVEAGNYATKLLNKKGKILEIRGLDGSSPSQERHDGFIHALDKFEDIEIVFSEAGDWKKEKAKHIIDSVLNIGLEFDLVFAQNDVMAKEVHNSIKNLKSKRDIHILGVDGLPGREGGIQMVLDNILDATFLYQTGGGMAIQLASDILNNRRVAKRNIIPTITIDKNNAPMLKSQTDQIEILHNKIERQKLLLSMEVSRNRTQKIILFLLIIVLSLFSALAVLVFINLKGKKKANLILTEKNDEIEQQNKILKEQHEKLIKIDNELQEATSTKLTFFTNISHEFKTPLTLIKGPIEMLLNKQNSNEDKKLLNIVHSNTVRLLAMINQLMDFRKLDKKKLALKASENNLNQFIHKTCESFKLHAESQNIALKINSNVTIKSLWFDSEKMETVMYNLLSNAFKYTNQGGEIRINLTQEKVEQPALYAEEVCISIQDNGVGIPAKHLDKIFERFFQNGSPKMNKGAGIGLNFSKGLIELHKGRITVQSKEGEGTTFCVCLPVGNIHLSENEMVQTNTNGLHTPDPKPLTKAIDITGELDKPENYIAEDAPLILVVEDIPDVAEFIKLSLGNDFRIITAQNGKAGLEKITEEEPDLIISDVMMPEMNGITFTKTLKSQIATSHIPIILLTAKSSIEDKIEGIEEGADSFIEKPFNSKLLKKSVLNLLKSRADLREHYRDNLSFSNLKDELSQVDKKFLEKLKKLILQNIGKKEFNVDELGQAIGISRVQLYRKVKKLTNMSVSEFIISVKLKRSLEHLRKSGNTITEVAYESGFSSQSYYTRCFKEQFKISPSDYARKYKN